MKLTVARLKVPILFALILIFLSVNLSGCWSRVEIEKMAFISMVGVDAAGPQELLVSFQIVNPGGFAQGGGGGGGGEGGGGEKPFFVLSVKARSIPLALAKVSQESPHRVRFKQLNAIVLGEDLGREGVAHVIDFFVRHWEMRRSIWVVMAHGSAQEILLKGAPVQEKVPGVAVKVQMETPQAFNPTFYPVVLGDFLTDISEEGRDAIVAAVRVRPMQENKAEESKTGFTENNQLMFEGAGVFRGDKLVGYLGPSETRGARWVKGKIDGGIFTVPTPSEGLWASLVTTSGSSRIEPVITEDNISFRIEITDEGYI
jgi:spore germination protein KC